MGFYFRKAFRAGPIRFNLSKSGIGVSTGIKGLRVGTGPRGAYISGGAKGIYFRESLTAKKSEGRTSIPAVPPANAITNSAEQQSASPKYVAAPRAGGYAWAIIFGLAGMLLIATGIDEGAPLGMGLGLFCVFCAVASGVRKTTKIRRYREYDILLEKIGSSPDETALQSITSLNEVRTFKSEAWGKRREFIYAKLVQEIVEKGIDECERLWLERLRRALIISDADAIHLDIVQPLLWQAMGDETVTAEEEEAINELLKRLDLSWSDLPAERDAFDQFVRGRKVQAGELPVIDAGINFQRNEVCHHKTTGAFLENKIIRSYTVAGQRQKEEALVATKEGDIYITSKRVLMVAGGISSIAHEKVLDIEIDADKKLITLIKDGRQKPIYIQAPDAIYTGILLDQLSKV
jgi:hypothetical protein